MDTREPRPTVPGWEVRRELGRGGSSTVWLVADAQGTEAALKIPGRGVDAPAELLDLEMRAVGELAHEHLVRPLGVVRTDRGPGLLSEYLPGGSLGALVRAAGPLPLGQVVTVLVPVAQALQALHGHGVVHGDLSPGNILFSVRGRPAVADLGASRLLGGPAHRTGTPGFFAPELNLGGEPGGCEARDATRSGILGQPSAGLEPAADVYSLAAVGWFALTGRAPARTASRAPLPLIVPDIPPEVVELLEAALDEEPARRPSADRFAVACYRWAEPEPVDLYPAASPEVARELPTRHRDDDRVRRARRRTPSRRRLEASHPARRRRVLAAGAATALVAWAVVGGVVWGGVPTTPPEGTTSDGTVQDAKALDGEVPDGAAPDGPRDGAASGAPTPAADSSADPPAESPSAGPEATGTPDVAGAAASLGPARAQALLSLDPRQVERYSVPDSPAARADIALQRDLESQGLRYEGLRLRTTVAGGVEPVGETTADVPLEMAIGPYRTLSEDGGTVAEKTSPAMERFTARMERTREGWRVREILP
jgi:eukaryotic-like serine/threonine-protein kinase